MREPDATHDFEALNSEIEGVRTVVPARTRKAWRCPTGNGPSISLWLVQCPHLHAAWDFWWLSLVHLRDFPGMAPGAKQYAEAEYELSIFANNPEHAPDPDDRKTVRPLLPFDAEIQFHGVTDAEAIHLLETWARDVVLGKLSPDSDFRRTWIARVAHDVQRARARPGI